MPGVTVIIPNWNRRELVEALLKSLRRQTYPIDQVLVVDNGSTDDSIAVTKRYGAAVIAMGRNAGFSAAVNRGIRESRTEWVAVLNNDVEPAPDWLEQLMKAAQQPRVWFAVGKLLNQASRNEIDGTFDLLCRGGCAWRAGHGRPDSPIWNKSRRIHFAPFTASLFRSELFHKVGYLDERFESYMEDVDFSFRCAALGYSGVYAPEAFAYHAGSATLGRWHGETIRRIARNQVLLAAKHYPARSLLRYCWPILVAQSLWGAVALRHGSPFSYLRGKLEGLWMLWGVRRDAGPRMHPRQLARLLEQSESEIYKLQRRTGFDAYWRAYFLLTCLT